MPYSQVLLGFSGIALIVNNRKVGAPFNVVELLFVVFVLAHETTAIVLSFLGAPNIDPWYLANRPAALILSVIYGTAALSQHLAIILASRALARHSGACAQLTTLTSIFIGIIVTVGFFVETMLIRYTTMTPYPTMCLYNIMKASFAVHNYALPAIDIVQIIALGVARRKENVVKRHYDILIACTSLLLVSRLYTIGQLYIYTLVPLIFIFRSIPEAFVVFIAAYYARDFSAMVSGQSDVGLPVSYEDSKPPVDSSEPYEVVTVVDEKTGASLIDIQ
jgi:hypothetical protein